MLSKVFILIFIYGKKKKKRLFFFLTRNILSEYPDISLYRFKNSTILFKVEPSPVKKGLVRYVEIIFSIFIK